MRFGQVSRDPSTDLRTGEDNAFDLVFYGGVNDILYAENIGLHGFKRRAFAKSDMFESRCMKNEVNALHPAAEFISVTHIRQKKCDLGMF